MWNPWRDSPLYQRDLRAWKHAHERPRGLVILVGVFSLIVGVISLQWRLPPSTSGWMGGRPSSEWIDVIALALSMLPVVFAALVTGMMGLVEVYWGRDADLDELYLSHLGGEAIIGAKTAAIVAPFVYVFAIVGVTRVGAALLLNFLAEQPLLEGIAWAIESAGRSATIVIVAALTAGFAWVRAIAQPNPWRALWEVMALGVGAPAACELTAWGAEQASLAIVEWVGLQDTIEVGHPEAIARTVVWIVAPVVLAFPIRPIIRWAGRRFDRDYRDLA